MKSQEESNSFEMLSLVLSFIKKRYMFQKVRFFLKIISETDDPNFEVSKFKNLNDPLKADIKSHFRSTLAISTLAQMTKTLTLKPQNMCIMHV